MDDDNIAFWKKGNPNVLGTFSTEIGKKLRSVSQRHEANCTLSSQSTKANVPIWNQSI